MYIIDKCLKWGRGGKGKKCVDLELRSTSKEVVCGWGKGFRCVFGVIVNEERG